MRIQRWRRHKRDTRSLEIVGTVWWWDRAYPMTREFAEWADYHVLPFGVSIIRDERRLL